MPGTDKVYMMDKDKKKKFKPHNMYCKDGSKHFAKTYQEHLKFEKKGCGHKPIKKKYWLTQQKVQVKNQKALVDVYIRTKILKIQLVLSLQV